MSESGIPEGFKTTELCSLPEEWKVVRLGGVAKVKYGKANPKDTENIPVVGSGGIYSITTSPLVEYPTIIIGRKGTAGKVWLLLKPCYPSDTTFYLEWKRDIDVSFAQDAKEKTGAVIVAAKSLKKSLMHHRFTYGPVPAGAAESAVLVETEIGLVPDGWEVVRLGEVAEFSRKSRSLDINKCSEILFIPMEYIPTEEIYSGEYDLKNAEEIKSGTFFFKGDLLVAKITPSFENGKQCIVDDIPTDFGYATTEVCPLRETTEIKILYLFYYLKRHNIISDIAGKMEGSTGRQRVPKNVLKNVLMPLPPLPTQQKIASTLSTVGKKIEAEENKKIVLDELFKSLLHNLITGKIRANHPEAIP